MKNRSMWYFCIFLTVIVSDQATKYWIVHVFHLYESRQVIPGLFNLVYATNTGVAFSMFDHYDSRWSHYVFIGINLLAVMGFTIAHFRMKKGGGCYIVPFALIAGGAAGNVIDRLRYGAVVDFLDFHLGIHHFPTFNIADSAICVGVVLFLIINFLEEKKRYRVQ